jgi:hypothetical protein
VNISKNKSFNRHLLACFQAIFIVIINGVTFLHLNKEKKKKKTTSFSVAHGVINKKIYSTQ